jgi:hypothetical protein
MSARNDTEYGRGLYFVTWQYDRDRTGVEHGHYTEDYNAAKEDFASRSGLVSKDKLFTPEQAVEMKTSIDFRIENDDELTYATENALNDIAGKLNAAYFNKNDEPIELSDKNSRKIETHIESITEAKTIFGIARPGDWVMAAGNSDYKYLIGTVTSIDKLGLPEHGTENKADDIHVDFTSFDYPSERIAEIIERFNNLYGEVKTFDELPLDDVIMAPNMLIRISN